MASLLGGRTAEQLIFGDVTTGARQDLAVVTDIARKMVTDFGMSELGIVPSGRKDDSGGSAALGCDLATQIDLAVKGLIDDAAAQASRILTERHAKLVEVAEHLKVVETIDGDDLDELLGPDWVAVDAA
jgi:cell division protease FtsH